MTIEHTLTNGQGETFEFNITYKQPDGEPVDLTGHSVDMQIATSKGMPIGTYAATLGELGHIQFIIPDETTDTWPLGRNAYVVIHTTPDGTEKWILKGRLYVNSKWSA